MANANKIRREPIKIELDKSRELKYDLNAFIELEERYGSVDAALRAMEQNSIKAVRLVLWAGLIHEDPDLTEKEVGSLVQLYDLEELSETLGKAMMSDLPDKNSPNA